MANPRTVGALLPSSRELARAMVRGLELEAGQVVLELGPGTGALTTQIHRLLPDPRLYLGIEQEPRFVEILRQSFPELHFIHGRAEEAEALCERCGVRSARVILSGLPFANQRAWEQDRILENVGRLLPDGGTFRTFQYFHGYALPTAVRFRRKMHELTGRRHRRQPLLGNVPPAYVLTWVR